MLGHNSCYDPLQQLCADALVKPPELGMGMSTQVQGEQENAISVNWLGWDLPD